MTEKNLEIIIVLFAGVQAAIVEIVEALHASGATSKTQIAQRLTSAADNLATTAQNGALIALTMRQIATGLTGGNPDTADEIRRLLH